MSFNIELCNTNIEHKNIVSRESSRVVAVKNDKYLMISTKRGDLIFPGGGIENNETLKEAAARELSEETGYSCIGEPKYIGKAITKREDKYEKNSIYVSTMHYFLTEVHEDTKQLSLSNNEIELQIKPIWLSKGEIIKRNQSYQNQIEQDDVWVQMVEYILEYVENIRHNY